MQKCHTVLKMKAVYLRIADRLGKRSKDHFAAVSRLVAVVRILVAVVENMLAQRLRAPESESWFFGPVLSPQKVSVHRLYRAADHHTEMELSQLK